MALSFHFTTCNHFLSFTYKHSASLGFGVIDIYFSVTFTIGCTYLPVYHGLECRQNITPSHPGSPDCPCAMGIRLIGVHADRAAMVIQYSTFNDSTGRADQLSLAPAYGCSSYELLSIKYVFLSLRCPLVCNWGATMEYWLSLSG